LIIPSEGIVTEPDPGQPSESLLLHVVLWRVQAVNVFDVSKLPSLMTFALLGNRQLH
jgi:hypothetical protein